MFSALEPCAAYDLRASAPALEAVLGGKGLHGLGSGVVGSRSGVHGIHPYDLEVRLGWAARLYDESQCRFEGCRSGFRFG